MINIQRVDMHFRDERLIEWLAQQGDKPIPAQYIAHEFMCHRHTVRAMIRRLELAGRLKVTRWNKRGGYSYQVLDIESCESYH
jgi:biotin operon repressor